MSASSIVELKLTFEAAHTAFVDALKRHDYEALHHALTRELSVMDELAAEIAEFQARLLQEGGLTHRNPVGSCKPVSPGKFHN
jgi:hypothetical protein